MRFFGLVGFLVLGFFGHVVGAQTNTPPPTPPPVMTMPPFAPVSGGNCGFGLPCGQVPWALPVMPILRSPTPLATSDVMTSGFFGHTPIPDFGIDVSDVSDVLGTANAMMSTPNIGGTPLSFEDEFETLEASAGDFFGLAQGISQISFGPFTPLFALFFGALLLMMLFKMMTLLLPIIGVVVGIVRKVIQVILDFIPL